MTTYQWEFPRYNSRRYGRPWGALITFKGNRPVYDFAGHWDGKAVVIDAEPGDVLAFGQKDYRGNGTSRWFVIVEPDGTMREVNEWEARAHWKDRQAVDASQEV